MMLYQATLAPDMKVVSFIYIFNVDFLMLNFFQNINIIENNGKIEVSGNHITLNILFIPKIDLLSL